jgi:cytochrome c oxidase cbb3-type subunit 3/ubiquinol-cytochrome c reductase cytochrome c subunit
MLRNSAIRRLQIVTALGALVVACGCVPPGKPNPADKPIMPDQILDFDRLYATNCAGCHGAGGKLGPAPPLKDAMFVDIVPDDALLQVIRAGRAGTPMPPFAKEQGGALTDAQIKVLAEGIKSNWKSKEPPAQSLPAYALTKTAGVQVSPGSRERGTEVFARACAGCHGQSGAGVEHEGVLTNAINVPAFLALISDQAVRRIIITGRSDLGMPNYAEHDGRPDDFKPLTSAEIDDLVALVADWRATGSSIVQTQP